ncbi:GNAT family N-acetyltransferase [Rhodococcus chondri]|uniref:GNAT family N-acetyltransferase n=1 Tax=Rhodococcus chondri TaxID=3065941 RepID=A0ABU7JVG0_9NOCA|nr:GNAT family N-acetyltransferase [Rhodococcus sp. CC-R104]MEE2033909.1 GNAT family N-acetyltransferase [Rhodococcus sp. CC-R104]
MSTPSLRESASPVSVEQAGIWDAEVLADVAAATFPLACPPDATREDIAAFVDEALSAERFSEYLTDPHRIVLKATAGDEIVGYLMAVDAPPASPEIEAMIDARPAIEISKMYVLPGHHGTGVSTALMAAIVERGLAANRAGLWLGVNQLNARARRFYEKNGFAVVGTRTFVMGSRLFDDYVMQRRL